MPKLLLCSVSKSAIKLNIMNGIIWSEENTKNYGLDYSTLKGEFEFFKFDIRYDYDGKPTEKPTGCNLDCNIYFNGKRIANKRSPDINHLKNYCRDYMQTIQGVFSTAKFV